MSSPLAAIDVRGVSKRFGARWALAHVSFRLDEGRTLLLTGANGSGKTTLLKLLATAIAPSLGDIEVFGLRAREQRTAVRDCVALLSHANALYEDLTAWETLRFLGELLGRAEPGKLATDTLAAVGLAAHSRSPVRQFSAGMKKRLSIARLLVKAPRLALFDEPFGELDPDGIERMEGFIRELKSRGTTVILATHLVAQGERLCDERLHLEGGRVTPATRASA